MSGDRPGHGPWRDPHENRRLVEVREGGPGVFELTVYPGADVLDLVGATARLPKVVFVDHRRAAPGDAAVVLVFRELPASPEGLAAPAPGGGLPPVSGWVPEVGPVRGGWVPDVDAALATVGVSGPVCCASGARAA